MSSQPTRDELKKIVESLEDQDDGATSHPLLDPGPTDLSPGELRQRSLNQFAKDLKEPDASSKQD